MKEVVDRIVQYPNRYKLTDVSTGQEIGTYDFTEVPGTVQQEGTEINAELFESIEQDIENAGNFDPNGTYPNLTAGEATHAQSADTATKASQDAAGNNIQSTYATKTELNTKANQTALDGVINGPTPVAKAITADSATNATHDAQGRNIASTNALKSEVGGGTLYRHSLYVIISASGDNTNTAFTCTIINRSATPFSTAQALLDYVKSEGWQISPQIRPLLVSGDTFNGDGLMYGIGEHTTYPDALGILYRNSSGKMAQNALYLTKMTVTDHVTEI